jgi:hypothetical protein
LMYWFWAVVIRVTTTTTTTTQRHFERFNELEPCHNGVETPSHLVTKTLQ